MACLIVSGSRTQLLIIIIRALFLRPVLSDHRHHQRNEQKSLKRWNLFNKVCRWVRITLLGVSNKDIHKYFGGGYDWNAALRFWILVISCGVYLCGYYMFPVHTLSRPWFVLWILGIKRVPLSFLVKLLIKDDFVVKQNHNRISCYELLTRFMKFVK